MKRYDKKNLGLIILSFTIPMLIMLAALAGLGVVPFGDKSLVISDGNGLYINYLGYAGRAFKGQEGILFSFEKGLGGNMMGSWGWFLLNPFLVLFSFTDVTKYMTAFTWVSVLNFSTCGLTMYLFLKDLYGHRISNLIFSTSYALNGFLVANVFQMNFFAVVPVLPLMAMGLRRIFRDSSPLLYIVSVSYSLLMNFYFGFMLCIASLLFFCTFFIAYHEQIENKRMIAIKYCTASFLAGISASVIWLPALLSLRGGRLDQPITNYISFKENMPFLDMFSKFFTGANSTSELTNGLPNLFVGILPLFLVILFFINKDIARQKKLAAAFLLCFYIISFYLVVLNILMHGGTVTNWFNYRDSFVFCFIILFIAAEEWQHISDEQLANLKKAFVILVVISMLVLDKQYEFLSGGLAVMDILILAAMFLPYRMYKKDPLKNPKMTFEAVVLVFVCINLFLNYYYSTKNLMVWSKPVSEYQEIVTPVSAMTEAVQESDDGFYRMEIGEQRSGNCGNDPMLYGYYGVGHGGSDDRNFVRAALSKLGVHRFNMRNNYGKGISAATDTLLGLRYIISKENLVEEKEYEKLLDLEEWSIYKNPYALPIAFVSNAEVENVTIDMEDVFDNLNRTWSALSGVEEKIFIEEEDVTFSSHNATDPYVIGSKEAYSIVESKDKKQALEKESDSTESELSGESSDSSTSEDASAGELREGILKEKPDNMNYIMYTWTAGRDGAVYSYNRSGMTEDNGSLLPSLNYEGYHHKGETVTSYIPVTNSLVTENLLEDVAGRFRIAYVDDEVLKKMSAAVLSRPSNIERIRDSHLKGSVTAEDDQKLLFTIPYDEGWSLKVDGKETELRKVLDVFMTADIEPGTHTYEMKFEPAGLNTGAAAAGISIVLIIIFIILDRRRTECGSKNASESVTLENGNVSEYSENCAAENENDTDEIVSQNLTVGNTDEKK